MVELPQEFFDWLESIGKLNQYEGALDISIDYAGASQEYRLNASEFVLDLQNRYFNMVNN